MNIETNNKINQIAILGSTGSIGTQALQVIEEHPDLYEAYALTANNRVELLIAQKADVLLMGGDYQEGCEYVEPLFSALARVKTPMGTYGVMGNNDYERCHDDIVNTMKHYGMRPLEHEVDTLRKDGQQIIDVYKRQLSGC